MPTYTCEPCGFSSTYKSSHLNHMKSKKHLRNTEEGASVPTDDAPTDDAPTDDTATDDTATDDTATDDTPASQDDITNALFFLEAKNRLQESRITRLEEIIKVMAEEIDNIKKTPMVDTQNNTTNNTNVNLLLQINVDSEDKLTIGGGMQRIPNLPETVRDQLENALPTSINTLFAKNNDMTIECGSGGSDSDDMSDTESFVDFDSEPAPKVTLDNIDEMIADECIRASIRKLLMEEDEYNRECAQDAIDAIVGEIEGVCVGSVP